MNVETTITMSVARIVSLLERLVAVEDVVGQLQQIKQSRNEGCMNITSGVQLRKVVIDEFMNSLEVSTKNFVNEVKDVFYAWLFEKVEEYHDLKGSSRKWREVGNAVVEFETGDVDRYYNKRRKMISGYEATGHIDRNDDWFERLVQKKYFKLVESRKMQDRNVIDVLATGRITAGERSWMQSDCSNQYSRIGEGMSEQSTSNCEQSNNEAGAVVIEQVGVFSERQSSSISIDTIGVNDNVEADGSDEDDEETRTAFIQLCRKVRVSDEREKACTSNGEEEEIQEVSTVLHEGQNRKTNAGEESETQVEDITEDTGKSEVLPTWNYEVIEIEDDSDEDGDVRGETDVTRRECHTYDVHETNVGDEERNISADVVALSVRNDGIEAYDIENNDIVDIVVNEEQAVARLPPEMQPVQLQWRTRKDLISYWETNMKSSNQMSSHAGYIKISQSRIDRIDKTEVRMMNMQQESNDGICPLCYYGIKVGDCVAYIDTCEKKHYVCQVCAFRFLLKVPETTLYLKESILRCIRSEDICSLCNKRGNYRKGRYLSNEDTHLWRSGSSLLKFCGKEVLAMHQHTDMYCNWIVNSELLMAIRFMEPDLEDGEVGGTTPVTASITHEMICLYQEYTELNEKKFNCSNCNKVKTYIDCCAIENCVEGCQLLCRLCVAARIVNEYPNPNALEHRCGLLSCQSCQTRGPAWNPLTRLNWCSMDIKYNV